MAGDMREIEQKAGSPFVPPVDPVEVDAHRRKTYLSYESFLREKLTELDRNRPNEWKRDYSSLDAYERSISLMRTRLKEMLGFWVEPKDRLAVKTWDYEVLLETDDFTARRFRIEIFPGLETYGIELIPKTAGRHPGLLAQHGYGGTPELACGLVSTANAEDYSYRSIGIRAAQRGFCVVAIHHPTGYGTTDDSISTPLPEFPNYSATYGKNRLHRMAIMAGGTLFGLDMMASSRGIDLLVNSSNVDSNRIAMYGLSQGGMSALYLPALDQRIRASIASAYFNWRFPKLIGPHRTMSYLDSSEEDKFFGDVIRWFSDSDIVSLIAPRAFAVEAGLQDGSVDFEKAEAEFERAKVHYDKLEISDQVEFIPHAEGHVSATRRAFEFLTEKLV